MVFKGYRTICDPCALSGGVPSQQILNLLGSQTNQEEEKKQETSEKSKLLCTKCQIDVKLYENSLGFKGYAIKKTETKLDEQKYEKEV